MKNKTFAKFAGLRLWVLFLGFYSLVLVNALERPENYSSNKAWQEARQAELQRKIDAAVKRGASPAEITAIRQEWQNENRALESGRTKEFKDLVKQVYGVSDDKAVEKIIERDFEHSGTAPEKGQGRFGDIDLTPKPEAWEKIKEYAKKNPDKMKIGGGTIEIPGQEIVIHDPNKEYKYSVETGADGKPKIVEPGKGGAPVKKIDTVALRAADKESYVSYEFDKDGKIVIENGASVGYDEKGNPVKKAGPKIADPHLNTLDNMKKIGKNLDDRGNFEYKKNQETAKATMRIIEGAYGTDPSKWPPEIADMHKKCSQVKSGVALEELGIMDKKSKNEFYDKMEKTVKDAYAKTSAESAKKESELVKKREQTYKEMEDMKKRMGEMKKSGDETRFKQTKEELQRKKAEFEKTQSQLYEQRDLKARAEHGVVKNKAGAVLLRAQGHDVKLEVKQNGDVEIRDLKTKQTMSQSGIDAKLMEERGKKVLDAIKQPSAETAKSQKKKATLNTDTLRDPMTGREAFASGVGTLLDIYGAYQAGQETGEAMDLIMDMNPTLKKGVQIVTAGASLLTLSNSVKASTIGNIVAGAPGAVKGGATASIDEMTKWYLENPNAGDPSFFEGVKIGMRGANNFAKQYVKDTVYGLTVKPVVDVYQIAESGIGAFNAKRNQIETIRKNRENKEQMLSTAEKKTFNTYREKFDAMENEAKKILNDKNSSEEAKKRAKAVVDEVKNARNRLDWIIDEERLRDVSGEFVNVEKRKEEQADRARTKELFNNSILDLEKKWNEFEKVYNTVRVKISVNDKETGVPLDAEVSISGAKYKNLRESTRNGVVVFQDVPAGSYKINVIARGYEGKTVEYVFDPAKKKEYNGTFSLQKIVVDEKPVVAKLLVYVVDAETGSAIPGATIALESPDRGYSYSEATPTGAIEFPTLASGDYFVSATAPGYSVKKNLRIPIEPAKNANPRCRIALNKLAKQEQKSDGRVDFGKVFDNTYVQTEDGIKRAGDLKKGSRSESELEEWRRLVHAEIEKNYNSICPKCGGTISMMLNSYVDEDFFKSRIFCPKCGWKIDMAKLKAEYEKFKATGESDARSQEKKEEKNVSSNKEGIQRQIEALRAEGNAKLDQIRAELKNLEGKPLKKTCQSCGFSGDHWWMGDRWSCPGCEKCTMPSEVATSAGSYSQVRDDYKRRIAELEAKLK